MKIRMMLFSLLLIIGNILSAETIEPQDRPDPPAGGGGIEGEGIGGSGTVYVFFTEQPESCTTFNSDGFPITGSRTVCSVAFFSNCDYQRACMPN